MRMITEINQSVTFDPDEYKFIRDFRAHFFNGMLMAVSFRMAGSDMRYEIRGEEEIKELKQVIDRIINISEENKDRVDKAQEKARTARLIRSVGAEEKQE